MWEVTESRVCLALVMETGQPPKAGALPGWGWLCPRAAGLEKESG